MILNPLYSFSMCFCPFIVFFVGVLCVLVEIYLFFQADSRFLFHPSPSHLTTLSDHTPHHPSSTIHLKKRNKEENRVPSSVSMGASSLDEPLSPNCVSSFIWTHPFFFSSVSMKFPDWLKEQKKWKQTNVT